MAGPVVLVVDDSPTVLKCACDALTSRGIQVVAATDGEQAIEFANRDQPDVIVLDIILPKNNGFHVCRQIKTNPRTQQSKVLILSSKSQDSDKYWGHRQGADGYITKPFAADELVQAVEKLLESSSASDAQEPSSRQPSVG